MKKEIDNKVSSKQIKVEESDFDFLLEGDKKLAESKIELANLILKKTILEQTISEKINEIFRKDKDWVDRCNLVGKKYGLNVSEREWAFHFGKKAFVKVKDLSKERVNILNNQKLEKKG